MYVELFIPVGMEKSLQGGIVVLMLGDDGVIDGARMIAIIFIVVKDHGLSFLFRDGICRIWAEKVSNKVVFDWV